MSAPIRLCRCGREHYIDWGIGRCSLCVMDEERAKIQRAIADKEAQVEYLKRELEAMSPKDDDHA